jgi:hypothetical protein
VAAASGDESDDRVNRVERAPILCCASGWGAVQRSAVIECAARAHGDGLDGRLPAITCRSARRDEQT